MKLYLLGTYGDNSIIQLEFTTFLLRHTLYLIKSIIVAGHSICFISNNSIQSDYLIQEFATRRMLQPYIGK